MRTTRLLSAALILTASFGVAACDRAPTEPRAKIALKAPSYSLTSEGGDIYASSGADTVASCALWGGCRDLNTNENIDVDAIIEMLLGTEDPSCIMLAAGMYGLKYNNLIKVGTNELSGVDAGFIKNAEGDHVILNPSVSNSALWENRFVLLHESYHANGGYSHAATQSLRESENDSIYDPAAYYIEAQCNR